MEKELALVSTLITHNDILNGTPFQTFDWAFEIAKAFVEKYGVDETEWGLELEYEETVCKFAQQYALNKNWIKC